MLRTVIRSIPHVERQSRNPIPGPTFLARVVKLCFLICPVFLFAESNGHRSFLQTLFHCWTWFFFFCQCFSGTYRHARGKFGSHPFSIIIQSMDLVHHRHCVGEHCFRLDKNAPEKRISPKCLSSTKISQDSFNVYLSVALSLMIFHFLPILIHFAFLAFPSTLAWHSLMRKSFFLEAKPLLWARNNDGPRTMEV